MIKRSFYRLFLFILGSLPFKNYGYLHKICTYFLKDIVSYRKKTVIANLKSAFPHFSGIEIEQLKTKYYSNLVAYIFETLQVYTKKSEFFNEKIIFSNINLLKEGNSTIILGSHYGNWEWASVLLPQHTNTKVVAIYKPLNNQTLDGIIKKCRSRFGLELLPMQETVRYLTKSNENKIYIFVADQSPSSIHSGAWFDFLNQKTLFYQGAELLAKKHQYHVVYQKVTKINGCYHVSYELIDPNNITADYVGKLEQQITHEPALWLWSHKRWKFNFDDIGQRHSLKSAL